METMDLVAVNKRGITDDNASDKDREEATAIKKVGDAKDTDAARQRKKWLER
jgi:hypothetical protein